MNTRLRVLVTGVGGRSVGHQILQALLLLGDRYTIVATDADAFSYGLYQVDERYLVPRADDPGYIETIRRLVDRERIEVILPGTEAELFVLAEHRDQLGCATIMNPPEVVHLCRNKGRLAKWLVENGFRTPQTVSCGEWRALAQQVGFPLVGKPAENTGGSRHVEILCSDAEVETYLSLRPNPSQTLFQEYVGEPDREYTVGVALSHTGELIDSIALHRILTGLSLGPSRVIDGRRFALSTGYSQGIIVKHDRVQSVCEALALKLGARGPLNIQCRLDREEVCVFEVHPRFSGTTSIRAAAGFNEPDLLIKDFLFQEPVRRVEYRTDVAAIRAFSNLLVPLAALKGLQRI